MDKTFAKTILTAYGSLSKMANQIDDLVYRKAVSTYSADNYGFCNTERQIEDIVALMNKKNSLINLKLLADEIFDCMDRQSYAVLADKYILRLGGEQIAKNHGVSARTFYRKLDKAETSFAKGCFLRGIDDAKFKQDYFDQSWLKNVYGKVEEREAALKAASK